MVNFIIYEDEVKFRDLYFSVIDNYFKNTKIAYEITEISKYDNKTEKILEKAGVRIKKARLRRNIKAEALAESAGISIGTLAAIEKGISTVSIGAYMAVIATLGMEKDFEKIALDEEGKQQYRELKLRKRVRTKSRKETV